LYVVMSGVIGGFKLSFGGTFRRGPVVSSGGATELLLLQESLFVASPSVLAHGSGRGNLAPWWW
jgi:hypothetical protein